MINLILDTYAKQMEQYMGSYIHQPEGLVDVGEIGAQGGDSQNKILIFLLGVERESSKGMVLGRVGAGKNSSAMSAPVLYANLNIIIAAVFNEKRYKDSLTFLSLAITFLQNTPVFTINTGNKYTIELCTISSQEQSNIWTQFGGKYYPSVVCKIRRLAFDAEELKQIVTNITDTTAEVKHIVKTKSSVKAKK